MPNRCSAVSASLAWSRARNLDRVSAARHAAIVELRSTSSSSGTSPWMHSAMRTRRWSAS
jgi:hypothetical protein